MSKYTCRFFVRILLFFVILVSSLPCSYAQDNAPIEDKKQLEVRAKQTAEEAKTLEEKGQLKEAEEKYLAAEAIITTREGAAGLYRVQQEKTKKVQSLLKESHGLYDAGKTQEALTKLEEAQGLDAGNPSILYNLALCHAKLGDKVKAIADLDQCLQVLPEDDRNRGQLEQLKSSLVTGENPSQLTPEIKSKIESFNNSALAETKTPNEPPESETPKPISPSPDAKSSAAPPCSQLKELEPSLPKSPAVLFNLAKCAEEEGHQEDALRYLNQYLESAPSALDSDDVRLRVATDTSLTKLSGHDGQQVRELYASAAREIDLRKYGRAIEDLLKAEQLIPDYATTKWRLALIYEASGNITKAHDYYSSYRTLEPSEDAQKEAAAHMGNLETEKSQYDNAVREGREVLNPLILKAMNLDYESPSGSQHNGVSNDTSYAYVRNKLEEARRKLDPAAAVFPLGAEVNELLAIIYMQGNNPAAALRCYDIVASQHLPVSFYGTVFTTRDKKTVRDVKVELFRDDVRLIYLSTYDPKKKKFEPPVKPAGTDALGNLIVAHADDTATGAEDPSWKTTDLKGVETKNNYVALNTGNDEIFIRPLNMTSETPYQGIPARKFGNTYARLFLRYMGYDNTKLGPEHMTGGEKFAIGMTFAAAGMGGYAAFAGGGAFMMTTQLMVSMYAVNSALNTLRANRAEQAQLIEGNDFKIIPSQSFDLAFREKFQ
jgi:tetratricopeptide (TPR) repeat protein